MDIKKHRHDNAFNVIMKLLIAFCDFACESHSLNLEYISQSILNFTDLVSKFPFQRNIM